MRRMTILLLLMAIALMLGTAVAGAATYNAINCAKKATSSGTCTGTSGADKLIDEANRFTEILGRGGNDLYIEYSGGTNSADTLRDSSSTSSDQYRIENRRFVKNSNDALWIIDAGGSNDLLNLSPTNYRSTDCAAQRSGDDLFINCPGYDNIRVFDYYSSNSIERFRFANGTFTLPKSDSTSSVSSAQEQTSPEPPKKGQHRTDEVSEQMDASASSESWQQVK
jgi:hypothetical protein